jgi:HlyD family secretion protein
MNKRVISSLVIVALLAGAGFAGWRYYATEANQPRYKTAKLERGPLTATVAATGTLNPVVSVQVGSQVSGQIKEILVDFNSPVQAGQLIARIDPETFQQKVRQAEADLEAARAASLTQRADLLRVETLLKDAQRDYDRKKQLVEKHFISSADLDKAESVLDTAKAQRQVSLAQVENSRAVIRQRETLLAQSKIDLGRTEIRSPVDGVVVKRSVDRGQTVAASLQAPELFIIAQNLKDMQVDTSIDEADVGRIHLGQKVGFSVDAFPGRQFHGEVVQVRKAAKIESNVVTYTVVVSAANPDLALLPGMTANVRITTAQKEDVLKVANAALRFRLPGGNDDKTAAPTSPTPGSSGGGGGILKQMRERLVKDLALDTTQQEKLDAVLSAQREKFAGARELPEAERAKAMERNRAEMRERIAEFLTPDQKKRYAEISAEFQAARAGGGAGGGTGGSGRVWRLDTAGKPVAMPVRLGLTDGTMTEILGDEIAVGTEVITGIVAPNAKSGSASGPRMF